MEPLGYTHTIPDTFKNVRDSFTEGQIEGLGHMICAIHLLFIA